MTYDNVSVRTSSHDTQDYLMEISISDAELGIQTPVCWHGVEGLRLAKAWVVGSHLYLMCLGPCWRMFRAEPT